MAAIPLIPLSVCFFDPVSANILRPKQRKFSPKRPIQTGHVNSFPGFWQSGLNHPPPESQEFGAVPHDQPPDCSILLEDSRSLQAPGALLGDAATRIAPGCIV